jgi:phosphatidylinositol alpha-mannosyltransferase
MKRFMKNSIKRPSLKIGLVFDDSLDSNDGVQQYVRTLGRWLIKDGHEVRFLVGQTKDAKDLQPYVYSLSRNLKVRGNQNKMFIPFFSKASLIRSALELENFDVLHVMTPFNPFMGSRVIRLSGAIPKVSSFHMVGGTWFINYGAYVLAALQRSTLRRIDTFLSVSVAAQKFERKYFKIESTVSPNMVTVDPYQVADVDASLKGEKATIVFLGRLVERKGAQHLLGALELLKSTNSLEGVKVHICGDGAMRKTLESFVKANGLGNVVTFHGFIDESEKPTYLASADIAVFPATGGEAFGIVLIEAMATGRCVVLGGDNSGYRTVLGGMENLLFDPTNHKQLAELLQRYIESPELRKSAIEWQTKTVREYDTNRVGSEIVAIYRKTIDEKSY